MFAIRVISSVPSCVHSWFCQLFDFEVDFGRLVGGLKKTKIKHILARYQARLGLTFHIHCFPLAPYRDSNIPNPFQVAFIDGIQFQNVKWSNTMNKDLFIAVTFLDIVNEGNLERIWDVWISVGIQKKAMDMECQP